MYTFIPLAPGTIADLFSRKRNPPSQKVYDPLGLPRISTQCAHVNVLDKPEGGYDYIGCTDDADLTGRHGWLCQKHANSLGLLVRRQTSYRNKDQEIVESILATEARAFRDGTREIIHVGAKTRIECLA